MVFLLVKLIEVDQGNLLKNMVECNKKSRPKNKEGKEKKKYF